MARHIRTEIDIDASPEEVWSVLTDLASFAQWNPFMVRASGELGVGETLTLTMIPKDKEFTLRPRVVECTPSGALRWMGRLGGIPGLFTGEHAHELEPTPEGHTRYVQSERFTGVLVPFVGGSLAATEAGFTRMNSALKARVESLRT